MTIKIDKKITEYSVVKQNQSNVKDTTDEPTSAGKTADVVQMHEKLERPPMLQG